MTHIETDYLVVGAGAAGLAFTDALVAASESDVVLIDRRDKPGGHWIDAYEFVRLHQPSAYYGVGSLTLGTDAIDQDGPNAGFYERAAASEICTYFEQALTGLLDTGRVRFLAGSDYVGGGEGRHTFTDLASGEETTVRVRRRLVDASFLETSIPATHTPSFAVDAGVAFVAVNALAEVPQADGFVIIGGGKTAMDACSWLLDNGVPADAVRWIRPREAWLLDRRFAQPLDGLAVTMEGQARQLQAAAEASSVSELFERLEAGEQLCRLDPTVEPTMYHCATISQAEMAQLRTITDVVRLGHVSSLGVDRIHLAGGSIPTSPGMVHVDCSAYGLRRSLPRTIFEPDRITPQAVRSCQPTFNAGLIGHVEASYADDDVKNRLCPPNRYPSTAVDWLPNTATSQRVQNLWGEDPELTAWMEGSRLNTARGLRSRLDDPVMVDAVTRMINHAEGAVTNLNRLMADMPPA
ncbi:MAG TPA: NAD(P)-binding protein [Acidimicrobiales bacterium]